MSASSIPTGSSALTRTAIWLAYRNRSPLEVLAEGDER